MRVFDLTVAEETDGVGPDFAVGTFITEMDEVGSATETESATLVSRGDGRIVYALEYAIDSSKQISITYDSSPTGFTAPFLFVAYRSGVAPATASQVAVSYVYGLLEFDSSWLGKTVTVVYTPSYSFPDGQWQKRVESQLKYVMDAGGGEADTIPVSASPTLDSAGEIAYDTTDSAIKVYDGSAVKAVYATERMPIVPTAYGDVSVHGLTSVAWVNTAGNVYADSLTAVGGVYANDGDSGIAVMEDNTWSVNLLDGETNNIASFYSSGGQPKYSPMTGGSPTVILTRANRRELVTSRSNVTGITSANYPINGAYLAYPLTGIIPFEEGAEYTFMLSATLTYAAGQGTGGWIRVNLGQYGNFGTQMNFTDAQLASAGTAYTINYFRRGFYLSGLNSGKYVVNVDNDGLYYPQPTSFTGDRLYCVVSGSSASSLTINEFNLWRVY